MNKEQLHKLAKSLMFSLTDEEANIADKEFQVFLKQVEQINKIDTKGVKPLDYPFEAAIGELREDVSGDILSVEEVLSNTDNKRENMVKIPKVVI